MIGLYVTWGRVEKVIPVPYFCSNISTNYGSVMHEKCSLRDIQTRTLFNVHIQEQI